MSKRVLFSLLGVGLMLFAASTASALDYGQDFSANIDDWNEYSSPITWNSGAGTATIGMPADSTVRSGAYTWFDGHSGNFGNGFTASIDINLDTSWLAGEGFDYSVAQYNSSDSHAQDFIFHVGVVEVGGVNSLRVNVNNNSIDSYDAGNNLNIGLLQSGYEVGASGWYTFEQVFHADAGSVSGYAVDLNMYAQGSSTALFTSSLDVTDSAIISDPTKIGGHGYGWFTFQDVQAGLEIDNVTMCYPAEPVPEPASLALLSLGLGGLAMRRRRKRA